MRRLPDESTILLFRHLLEEHGFVAQILSTVNRVLQERGLTLKKRNCGRCDAHLGTGFHEE